MIQICNLVSPETYKRFGEGSSLFIDSRWFAILYWFKDRFGEMPLVNNWREGGGYKYSGERPFDCTKGAERSQHKCGRAIDLKLTNYDPQEIRGEILNNVAALRKLGVTRMEENTPSWVHIDLGFVYPVREELFIIKYTYNQPLEPV